MLKRITTAALAALAIVTPVMADTGKGRYLDPAHKHLWNTLEAKGVWLFINPKEACQDPKRDPDGVYFYARRAGKPILAVCQDNRHPTDTAEVRWTLNDRDTLRHEAMHFLQDCLDGDVSQTLTPFYDGPGGQPGDITYEEVMRRLGQRRADRIAYFYGEKLGASDKTIRLEHEAFYVASNISPLVISEAINQLCPVK